MPKVESILDLLVTTIIFVDEDKKAKFYLCFRESYTFLIKNHLRLLTLLASGSIAMKIAVKAITIP